MKEKKLSRIRNRKTSMIFYLPLRFFKKKKKRNYVTGKGETVVKLKCLKRRSRIPRAGSLVRHLGPRGCWAAIRGGGPPVLPPPWFPGRTLRLFALQLNLVSPHLTLPVPSSLGKWHGFTLVFALYYNTYHPRLMSCIFLWFG